MAFRSLFQLLKLRAAPATRTASARTGSPALTVAMVAIAVAAPVAFADEEGEGDRQALLAVAGDFLYRQVSHLGDDVHIELEPPGAQLPPCVDPQPFLPANTALPRSRVTVGVRCEDGRTRYLPARLQVMGAYLAASRDLAAGTTIDSDSAALAHGDLAALPGTVLRSHANATGQVTRQRLAAGTPLLDQHLAAVPLVRRGERVTVESGGRGFRVSREGEALEPGGLGDSVRVQLDRRTVIDARVSGTGRVTANPR
jgi:flagella basal body P-ring formation protein FlgA